MHRFYTDCGRVNVNDIVLIEGQDVNHIKNVLRLSVGEHIIICNGEGYDYNCVINSINKDYVEALVEEENLNQAELDLKVTLFQGAPKKDKMEFIIQKAVELGVYEIYIVITKRTVVKFDNQGKEDKKIQRWQSIAESAAKQSGRGIIPKIKGIISFKEAVKLSKDTDMAIIPYEKADDMEKTREVFKKIGKAPSCSVFIGPEGGFSEEEIALSEENNIIPVTLGKRILRTETAGMAVMSVIMFNAE
ncbi:MAG: 16S rRNA (uracil(1498)-N(3))-methyltransferase [Lachnospiraceae bacterium]|nr:16S rRNA (uracil(1498)-N(3))-methyltransferase [Lachnospiraceae bacterium]